MNHMHIIYVSVVIILKSYLRSLSLHLKFFMIFSYVIIYYAVQYGSHESRVVVECLKCD